MNSKELGEYVSAGRVYRCRRCSYKTPHREEAKNHVPECPVEHEVRAVRNHPSPSIERGGTGTFKDHFTSGHNPAVHRCRRCSYTTDSVAEARCHIPVCPKEYEVGVVRTRRGQGQNGSITTISSKKATETHCSCCSRVDGNDLVPVLTKNFFWLLAKELLEVKELLGIAAGERDQVKNEVKQVRGELERTRESLHGYQNGHIEAELVEVYQDLTGRRK